MKDNADLSKLLHSKKKRINSRTKGNAFERKISEILNTSFNTNEFMRTPGSGAFATTHKLPSHLLVGGDLITPSSFPFLIECKKGYDFKVADLLNPKSQFMEIVYKLVEEAKRFNKEPLLIFQQDRQNILCLINSSLIHEHIKYSIHITPWSICKLEDAISYIKSCYKI